MIFAESLIAVGLLFYAIQRKLIQADRMLFPLVLIGFAFSLLPSLSIPYILDDVDHFHDLAKAIHASRVVDWLFRPHNEHVIPLIKALYFLCYTSFWLNPEAFHVLVIAVCIGNLWLTYKLVRVFTGSGPAAIIGATIVSASNLADDAMFIGTNAQIIFCVFFLLLLFYAMHQYALTRRSRWRLVAFGSVLLAPSTFALGLTSFIFAVLFWRWCLPADLRRNSRDLLLLLFVGWLLSLAPYLAAMNAISHADHYRDLGRSSVFEVARLALPLKFLSQYVGAILIPSLFANRYLAFGVFFVCALAVINYAKDIDWKKVGFFACFGLFNNFIIFVFRAAWGTASLDTGRYYVFPVIMIAFCYPLILSAYLRNNSAVKGISTVLLAYLVCFFAISNGALTRYRKGIALLEDTNAMSGLYVNFRNVFEDYLRDHHPVRLEVRNEQIDMPMSRYSRTREFYATYILPESINQRVMWSTKTDPAFAAYVKAHDVRFLSDDDRRSVIGAQARLSHH